MKQLVQYGRGRPPNRLERERRDKLIDATVNRAEESLLPLARKKFRGFRFRRTYRHKLPRLGNGPLNQREVKPFLLRITNNLGSKNLVYVFWKGKTCLYVGQSAKGVAGGGGLWKEYFWRNGTRIEVFSSRNYRQLSALECLAGHLYDPKHSTYKPPKHPYDTPCPVHEKLKDLRYELRRTFALRR